MFALVPEWGSGAVRKIDIGTNSVSTVGGLSMSLGATAVDFFSDGNSVLYATRYSVSILSLVSLTSTLVAGSGSAGLVNGVGSAASFYYVCDVKLFGSDLFAMIAESLNHAIRKINLTDNSVVTLAGNGTSFYAEGTGNKIGLMSPQGVCISADVSLMKYLLLFQKQGETESER